LSCLSEVFTGQLKHQLSLVSISDAATEMNGPDKESASPPERNIRFVLVHNTAQQTA
jgi:hypothetical protein